MFSKIRLPSAMASTMVAKQSSSKITSLAPLATSVPAMPMATPMLARLSAPASLVPSPVIATTCPWRCRDSTMVTLSAGCALDQTRTCAQRLSICSLPAPLRAAHSEATQETSPSSGCKIPKSFAIATAVARWSPVTMATRIPALWHVAMAWRTEARGGSIKPTRAKRTRPPDTSFSKISDPLPLQAFSSSTCLAVSGRAPTQSTR
mmetsp:Transcript_41832/g.106544  ORF Transcript_41832/g.106544 Transcript_41832/m.106544 type:complete len:206 (-) Transcript_41832:63-680(-)